MFFVNPAMVNIDVGTAGLVALLGYFVVFFGLILLMFVIMIVGKIMVSSKKKEAAAAPVKAAPAAAPAPVKEAPGSAGEVKLFDVPDKDAAMLMAIVANKLGKPLNTLRFKSIKEVK